MIMHELSPSTIAALSEGIAGSLGLYDFEVTQLLDGHDSFRFALREAEAD